MHHALAQVCTRQPPALHPRARTYALHGRADCGTPPASSPELLTLRAAPQDAARRRHARAPRASRFGPCGPIWACEQQYSHQRSTSVKKHPEYVFEPICDAYRRMSDEKKRSGERSISKYNKYFRSTFRFDACTLRMRVMPYILGWPHCEPPVSIQATPK